MKGDALGARGREELDRDHGQAQRQIEVFQRARHVGFPRRREGLAFWGCEIQYTAARPVEAVDLGQAVEAGERERAKTRQVDHGGKTTRTACEPCCFAIT